MRGDRRRAHFARPFINRAVPGDRRRAHFARPCTNIELCVPEQGTPFLLSAHYRLRGHAALHFMQEKKRSEKALRSFLPLICCPARTADKRPPRPASCQSPPPKAFPALGIHPASGLTSLLFRKRCSISHNASSFPDYREIHPYSQLEAQAIRSLSEMQLHVSDLSASPRQGVQRKSVRLGPNASLCTHCHDGVVRPGTKGCSKWR